MKSVKIIIGIIGIALLTNGKVLAQAERLPNQQTNNQPNPLPNTSGYNPNSVRPIHESDIMYRRTIWRDVDLNEKQNQPMMAQNNEIVRLINDAVMAGLLTPYDRDSLHTKITKEEFLKRMVDPNCQPANTDELEAQRNEFRQQKRDGFITQDELNARLKEIDQRAATGGCENLPIRDFTLLEIKEDMIFDKKRSRMYYDIQAITIYLPAENKNNVKKVNLPLASFRYKDLEQYFRKNPNAIWFNEQNNREHKNLADAFELRLFSSIITKISNPKDNDLSDIYADKTVRPTMAAQQLEYKLMEFEHNLWEF